MHASNICHHLCVLYFWTVISLLGTLGVDEISVLFNNRQLFAITSQKSLYLILLCLSPYAIFMSLIKFSLVLVMCLCPVIDSNDAGETVIQHLYFQL